MPGPRPASGPCAKPPRNTPSCWTPWARLHANPRFLRANPDPHPPARPGREIMRAMTTARLSALLLTQPPAHSLRQEFYTDPEIFRRELDRIFFKSWLYVGHVSEIPEKGDYMLFRIADESVIIVNTGA